MVKNFGKGGSGHKKMKNSSMSTENNKFLNFRQDGEDYALITEMLGGGRCRLILFEDFKLKHLTYHLGIIRGNMRKRQINRIVKEDIVLVSLRDYQEDKVDIINKYTNDEVKSLMDYNEIDNEFTQCNNISFKFKNVDIKNEHEIIFSKEESDISKI